eukprot:866804-Rhodomonas_salina.1
MQTARIALRCHASDLAARCKSAPKSHANRSRLVRIYSLPASLRCYAFATHSPVHSPVPFSGLPYCWDVGPYRFVRALCPTRGDTSAGHHSKRVTVG